MTQEKNIRTNKKSKKKKKFSIIKLLLVFILVICIIGGGAIGGMVLAIIKDAPEIDPTNITSLLDVNSVILDQNGNLIEKVQSEGFRTYVTIDKIPDHLEKAFISIEDERFETHMGVDIHGIFGALIEYVKERENLRGASTITQQLARNLYLSNERSIERKIKEAYLAIQIEKALTKDQILEAYLNRVDLSQRSYGVQEAAQTYFSKDVSDLTIAESAMLAGIVKSPPKYSPYNTIPLEDVDFENNENIIGQIDIDVRKYAVVFNQESLERQRVILSKMKELNFISQEEYNEAIEEDMMAAINPGQKKIADISSYFSDLVKSQVLDDLVEKAGYTVEEAESALYTGGLKIYATMDIDMQHKLEDSYNKFGQVLVGDIEKINTPILIDWSADKYGNLKGDDGKIVLYKKSNLLDDNNNLIIENGTFEITNEGNLVIKNSKFNVYPKTIDIQDFYTVDDRKNLVKHTVGSLALALENYEISDTKQIVIKSSYLSKNNDFYTFDDNNNLLINAKYFQNSDVYGVAQPQSAAVIIDYRTGEIKALVGGRDIEGSRLFNRAISQRQPGSAIKPVAVYLPALENGFTAADVIDDIPFYDAKGNLWPKNWYKSYWGINTIRQSVEQSINVNSVKLLEQIGISTSMEYLSKLGIIKEDGDDSFVTRTDNKVTNDENLSALGLGGMSRGLTPLELTAAYGAIANGGVYVEPISYTKVLDKHGNILLENKPTKVRAASPEAAFIMTDILRSTVTSGLANRAKLFNGNTEIPVAGKTGTTQDRGDIWFVGYTPYYAAGVWIGNDNPQIKISKSSSAAADYWSYIMKQAHDGYEPKNFDVPQEGIVTRQICTESGKLATELCALDPRGSTIRTEVFIKGTEPTEQCDVHVKVSVDKTTGKLANEYCPPELIEERIYIKREPAYNPEDHNGIIPKDYEYTVPTEVCDTHSQESLMEEWLNDWFNNGNEDDEHNWLGDWFNSNDDENDNDEDNIENNQNPNDDINNENDNNE